MVLVFSLLSSQEVRRWKQEFPPFDPPLTFMGFSSYVGVPRSISASCSRLASSPGLSHVGGSHWVCLEEK